MPVSSKQFTCGV